MERRVFDWSGHVKGDYSQKPDLSTFTHMRLFHGCRPIDVQRYYDLGILVMPIKVLAEQFRTNYPDLPPDQLDIAISRVNQRDTVDTALDLRYLIEYASHYIVQGSETRKAIAANLIIKGEDLRERLKYIGVPTALVIDAPLDEIDCQTIEELDEQLAILAEKGTCEVCVEGDIIDFTVSFSKGVPPAWLICHKTIREATDPTDRSRKYRYSD